jgi:hypothetical protein
VGLARRDENNPSGFIAPKSAPKSARARKLDARSPFTAGSFKTRGGKPRLDADVSAEATVDEAFDGDDAVTSAVDAVNTILLTPPSARGKPHADVTAEFDTVVMPPPPPRVPVTSDADRSAFREADGASFSEREVEGTDSARAADDLDDDLGAATTAIPNHAVRESNDALDEDRANACDMAAATDPKTPAAPNLGSPFSAPATSPRRGFGTPETRGKDASDREMDALTPLRAVEDVTETAGFGDGFGITAALPRLATPTMDLTPLGVGAATRKPSPTATAAAAPSPQPANAKRVVSKPQPPVRRAFDATLFDAKDFEPTENVPSAVGGAAYAPFEEKDFEPTETVPSAVGVETAAETLGSADRAAKTPVGLAARVPPRPPTPKTGGTTPQWARDSKAWHEQQQAQMEALMARAKRELDDARGGPSNEAERRQALLAAMLEEQKHQLEQQRQELREAAENAAKERERMKAEIRAQMEAQERTRRRVSELASRTTLDPGAGSLVNLATSRDLGEIPRDGTSVTGVAPANLGPVEAQLRACLEAISARADESERLASLQRRLHREEADLHFRVAELRRYSSRLALDPAATLPADLPPMPPPLRISSSAVASGNHASTDSAGGDDAAPESYGAGAAALGGRGPAGDVLRKRSDGSVDEDGFYVVDLTKTSSGGSGGSTLDGTIARDLNDRAGGAMSAPSLVFEGFGSETARAGTGAADVSATPAMTTEPATAPADDAARRIARRRAPFQVLELRKEVLDVRFVGYGGDSAWDDCTPPSALMTTTADGCLRLFGAGARRPVA